MVFSICHTINKKIDQHCFFFPINYFSFVICILRCWIMRYGIKAFYFLIIIVAASVAFALTNGSYNWPIISLFRYETKLREFFCLVYRICVIRVIDSSSSNSNLFVCCFFFQDFQEFFIWKRMFIVDLLLRYMNKSLIYWRHADVTNIDRCTFL